MGGSRHAEREGAVKIFNSLAAARGLSRIPENSGKAKVEQLIASIRHHVAAGSAWSGHETDFDDAVAAYSASWPQQGSATSTAAPAASAAAAVADQNDTTAPKDKEWKFMEKYA